MKEKNYLLILVLFLCIFLVGCKSSPSKKELMDDLSSNEFIDLYSIKDVVVDKELISDKTDVIDCTVTSSNEFADMIFYLKVNYTNYDTGGWNIDSIEESKPYSYSINVLPSDEAIAGEVSTVMNNEGVSDYSIISTEISKEDGYGTVTVRGIVKDYTYIQYYKIFEYDISFENGGWFFQYTNNGEDTNYAMLKDVIVGNRYVLNHNGVDCSIISLNSNELVCSFTSDEYGTHNNITINPEFATDFTGTGYYILGFDLNSDYSSQRLLIYPDKLVAIPSYDLEIHEGDVISDYGENSDESKKENSENTSGLYSDLYGDYVLNLNNEYDGWCELTISKGTEEKPEIIIIAYEGGNHETGNFEGYLFKDDDNTFTSYCESTEADLKLVVNENKLNVSITNSIYEDDTIMSGVYVKK